MINKNKWVDISPQEVEQKIKKREEVQLIDVREVEEYRVSRVPGSRLIPLGQLDVRHIDIDRNKEVIVICRSGSRSARACEYLSLLGFSNLKNMTGGMLKWEGEIEK
ncbi:MAG: rhodanese-like domain-containing protein [Bacilli bacterium]